MYRSNIRHMGRSTSATSTDKARPAPLENQTEKRSSFKAASRSSDDCFHLVSSAFVFRRDSRPTSQVRKDPHGSHGRGYRRLSFARSIAFSTTTSAEVQTCQSKLMMAMFEQQYQSSVSAIVVGVLWQLPAIHVLGDVSHEHSYSVTAPSTIVDLASTQFTPGTRRPTANAITP